MMRTLIVDDEPIARQGLRALLAHEHEVEIIGECGDGLQAVEDIEAKTPDLVLLDIQMPELDGFGVIAAVEPRALPILIFITAYDEFALRAFAAHALDYLLKPVKAEAFRFALQRARAVLQAGRGASFEQKLAALLRDLPGREKYLERFVIKSLGRVDLIKVDEVDWLQAEGDYVGLHHHGKKHLLRAKLGELEAQLNPSRFVRIHRSTIVRIDVIKPCKPLPMATISYS
ncbi:MAG: LytR/AlgR family response regulator transcription factor [bacterium]